MMNRFQLFVIAAALIAALILHGCGGKNETSTQTEPSSEADLAVRNGKKVAHGEHSRATDGCGKTKSKNLCKV